MHKTDMQGQMCKAPSDTGSGTESKPAGGLPEGLVEPPGGDRVRLAGVHIRPQPQSEGACLLVAQGAPQAMGGGSAHQQA